MTDVLEVRHEHATFCRNPLHMGPCTQDEGGPQGEIEQAQKDAAGAKEGSATAKVAAQTPQLHAVPVSPDQLKVMQDRQAQAQNQALLQHALMQAQQLASDLGIKGHPAVALYGRALGQQYQAIANYNRQVQLAQDAHDNAVLRNQAIVDAYKARLKAAQAADKAQAAREKLKAASKAGGGAAGNDAAIRKALAGAKVFVHLGDTPITSFELMRSPVEAFAVQRYQSRMHDMTARPAEMEALVASAGWDLLDLVFEVEHRWCEPGTFCRNPLHPGPCKGWKHTLHAIAPGAYHAMEQQRVAKLNEKRKARIAELEKAGKKVPAYLKKEITYDPSKLAPPLSGYTPPTAKEAQAALPATAKEIAGKLAEKHHAINEAKKAKQLDAATDMFLATAQALGVSGAQNKAVIKQKLDAAWVDSGEADLHNVPMAVKTADTLAAKASLLAGGLSDVEKQKVADDILQHVQHGVPEIPLLVQSAINAHKAKQAADQLQMEKAAHLSDAETKLAAYKGVKDWAESTPAARKLALEQMQKIIDSPHTTEGQKNQAGALASKIHSDVKAGPAKKDAEDTAALKALKAKQADSLHAMITTLHPAATGAGTDKAAVVDAIEKAHGQLQPGQKLSDAPGTAPLINHLANETLKTMQPVWDQAGLKGPGLPAVTKAIKDHLDEGKPGMPLVVKDAADLKAKPGAPAEAAKQRFAEADKAAQGVKPAFTPTPQEVKAGVGSAQHVQNAAKPDLAKLKLVGHAEQGVSQPAIYQDADGQRWLFKPLQEPGDGFRVNIDVAAAALQRKLGLPGPATYDVKIGGKRGSLQAMYDAKDAFPPSTFDATKLSARDAHALQAEHVLDWLIGNNDSHSGNFLRTADGQLVGIDKTHGFRYYREDKLDPDYAPGKVWPQHARTYQALYKAYANGEDVKLGNPLEGPSGEAIKKAMSLPDDQLRDMFRPFAEAAVASGYAQYGKKYANAEQLLNDLVKRKKNLAKDFGALYEKAWKERQAKLGEPASSAKLAVPKSLTGVMAMSKAYYDALPAADKNKVHEILQQAQEHSPASVEAVVSALGIGPHVVATKKNLAEAQKAAKVTGPLAHPDTMALAGLANAGYLANPTEWAAKLGQPGVTKDELAKLPEATRSKIRTSLVDAWHNTPDEVTKLDLETGYAKLFDKALPGSIHELSEPAAKPELAPSLKAKLVALENVVNDPEVSEADKVDMVASWSPEMFQAATPSQKAAVWVVLTQHHDDGNAESAQMLANHLDPSGKLAASIASQPPPLTPGQLDALKTAISGELSDAAKEAHAIANKPGFVMLKAKLPAYEALSGADFTSLDPATQQKIMADLDSMAIKLKDPKKLASAAGLKAKFQQANTASVPDNVPVHAGPYSPGDLSHVPEIMQALQEEAGHPDAFNTSYVQDSIASAKTPEEFDKKINMFAQATTAMMVQKLKDNGIDVYMDNADEKALKDALVAEHAHMLKTGQIGGDVGLTEQINEILANPDTSYNPSGAASEIMSAVKSAKKPTAVPPPVKSNVDGPSPVVQSFAEKASTMVETGAVLTKLAGQKVPTPTQKKKLIADTQAKLAAGKTLTMSVDPFLDAWATKHLEPIKSYLHGGDYDMIHSAAKAEMAYMIEHGLTEPPAGGVLATAKKAYKKPYTKKWGLKDAASLQTPKILAGAPKPTPKVEQPSVAPSAKIAAPEGLAPSTFDPAAWAPKGAKTVVEATPSAGGGTGSPGAYVKPTPIEPDAAKYHAAYKAAAGLFGSLGSKTTVADFQSQIAAGSHQNYVKTIADVFAKKYAAKSGQYMKPGDAAALPGDFEDMIRAGKTEPPAGSTLAKVQAAKIKAGQAGYGAYGYGGKGHAGEASATLQTGKIAPGEKAGFVTYHDGALIQDHPDPLSGGYGSASNIKQVVEAGEEASVAAYNAKIKQAAHGGTALSHTPLSVSKLKTMSGQKLNDKGATVAAARQAFYEYSGEGSKSYSSINPFLRDMAKKYMTTTDSSSQGEKIVDHHQAWAKAAAEASNLSPTSSAYVEKQIAQMDAAYEHSRLTHDTVIYRGTGGADVFGPAWDPDQSLVGYEYVEPSYASASTNYSTAHSFAGKGGQSATVFRVFAPKGTPGISLVGGQFSGESEILLKRGMRYRVIADNGWQNGRRQLDVEIIGWT